MKKFGSEINVLIDADIDEIGRIASPAVASAIRSFREGKIKVNPGGGGKYGEIEILAVSGNRTDNAKQKDLAEWMK